MSDNIDGYRMNEILWTGMTGILSELPCYDKYARDGDPRRECNGTCPRCKKLAELEET